MNSTQDTLKSIFKAGSKTYFYSSLFFDVTTRNEVSILYSFVRVADNFVDQVPQNVSGFVRFCEQYRKALAGQPSGDPVIDSFCSLMSLRGFEPTWVDAFLHAMDLDTKKLRYENLDEVIEYMYGSAEVIGLMMARILKLPDASLPAAQLLGRAMQYINFIRDISEDRAFNRIYIPQSALRKFSLSDLSEDYVFQNDQKEAFCDLIREQLECYLQWQRQAEAGFHYIPYRYLIPVKTASEMYKWTARTIARDPLIVFNRKVKPTVPRIVLQAGRNALIPLSRNLLRGAS
jgi:15-cis-phytoene synthase